MSTPCPHVDALREFVEHCNQVKAGNRGFISIPQWTKRTGRHRDVFWGIALGLGLHVDPSHGRYGACICRPR